MIAPVLQPHIGTAHLFQDGFVKAKSGFVGNPDKPSRRRAKPAAVLGSICLDLLRSLVLNGRRQTVEIRPVNSAGSSMRRQRSR
jgi:hypothetical protein